MSLIWDMIWWWRWHQQTDRCNPCYDNYSRFVVYLSLSPLDASIIAQLCTWLDSIEGSALACDDVMRQPCSRVITKISLIFLLRRRVKVRQNPERSKTKQNKTGQSQRERNEFTNKTRNSSKVGYFKVFLLLVLLLLLFLLLLLLLLLLLVLLLSCFFTQSRLTEQGSNERWNIN